MPAFITAVSGFLPHAPVDNDRMEAVLGRIGDLPSRTRQLILRSNRIRTRHYAIDPATGAQTHSNAQLTAEAVRRLGPIPGGVTCLACGTSSPDQLMPGHASMVHGELGGGPAEILSASGICASGMAAFKYAAMNVAAGHHTHAVATGSELASSFMRGAYCADPAKVAAMAGDLALQFDADFLRWMLSDGAGAALLSQAPAPDRLSLRIDWIDIASHAHALPACMYAGAVQGPDGGLTGWRMMSQAQAEAGKAMLVKQDVKLLNREIVTTAVERTLAEVAPRRGLQPAQVTWFLPHYSSDYFRQPLAERMAAIGMAIPDERWYTNLAEVGNVGSASFYLMLDGLMRSGRLRRGDTILAFVPESGRFLICYAHFTVV
jgi:3-oxoacyl-[acyl-carrier-protein] synthase III